MINNNYLFFLNRPQENVRTNVTMYMRQITAQIDLQNDKSCGHKHDNGISSFL